MDMVPSKDLLLLQFLPSNNKLLRSVRFKGRFQVQRKIQRRILHLDHIDSHYGNCIMKYLRTFAVRYRENCTFFSADDKARHSSWKTRRGSTDWGPKQTFSGTRRD